LYLSGDPYCPKCKEQLSESDLPDNVLASVQDEDEDLIAERMRERAERDHARAAEAARARPVAEWIGREFGPEFIYQNDNGNPAIVQSVLDEFRRLTGDTVVWEKHGQYWRERQSNDAPRRRMID
jgi:hypothetical protein